MTFRGGGFPRLYYRYLYLIKSHCGVLKLDIMKLLIESLVFSHLTYAMSAWGSSLKQHLAKRLERLQNRAVCLLFHLHKFDHIREYYRLPLPELIKYHSLCINFIVMAEVFHWSPLIQFGRLTDYHTRTKDYFSHPVRCRVCHSPRLSFAIRLLIGGTCYHQTLRATYTSMILNMM